MLAPPIVDSSHASLDRQAALCRAMLQVPMSDAIGVALSVLLQASHTHPQILRVVLNEPVVREGFRGMAMIQVLTKAAR